jgi:hypothetical protein
MKSLLEDIAESKVGIKGGYRGAKASANNPQRWEQIKIVGAIVALVLAAIIFIWQTGGGADPRGESEKLTVICSETGEVMKITLREGDKGPFVNPKTTRRTLFPAERCFWTRDGKAKLEPTQVLLNEYVGKPGETLCPDCGRPVRPRNPLPPAELMEEAAKTGRRN